MIIAFALFSLYDVNNNLIVEVEMQTVNDEGEKEGRKERDTGI